MTDDCVDCVFVRDVKRGVVVSTDLLAKVISISRSWIGNAELDMFETIMAKLRFPALSCNKKKLDRWR